jgi:lysozyme family protein
MHFEEAIKFTLKWEGGLSDDPDDRGGLTNLGITQPPYDEYRALKGLSKQSVAYISKEEALELYRLLYWNRAGCSVMPKKLAIAHFDWAVNSGVSRAVADLQRSMGGVVVDGGWGPKTYTQLQEHLSEVGEEVVLTHYLRLRERFYQNGQAKFREGWLNRLHDLKHYLRNTGDQKSSVIVQPEPQPRLTAPTVSELSNLPTKKGGRCDLRIERGTWLKLSTIQSAEIPESDRVWVESGSILPVLHWEEVLAGHLRITLDDKTLKGKNTWYVFEDHCLLRSPKPEAQAVITFAQKPKSQRPIRLIRLGVVDLDDPVTDQTPNFRWYELTHGGERLPPNEDVLNGMIRCATLAQKVRNHLGKPLVVTSGYRPPEINRRVGGARFSRHLVGDALDFVVPGMTGRALYNKLDHLIDGGLGQYRGFPNLIHIDARDGRARWTN